MTDLSKGLDAISRPSARVLILGSLPGALSIRQQEYYAHPRNVFWRIIAALLDFDPALPYANRTEALNNAGIALWDACASAHRHGSLDSAIQNHCANNFEDFFVRHPQIELICFNGQKAAAIYRRSVLAKLPQKMQPIAARVLPSTSPANAGVSYEEKLRRWAVLLPFCRFVAVDTESAGP